MTMLTAAEVLSEAQGLDQAVHLAIGAASMCWQPRPSVEVFDSTEAGEIADALITWIRTHPEERAVTCPVCRRTVREWISADGYVHCRATGGDWRKHRWEEET